MNQYDEIKLLLKKSRLLQEQVGPTNLAKSIETKIDQIDNKINNIKIEKNQVNNYYTQKKEEIKNSTNKQIDSLLRGRYKNL